MGGRRSARAAPQAGRWHGTARGEGYTECSACGGDFWVHVDVRADRVAEVRPDPGRPGYIPEGSERVLPIRAVE